MLPLVLALLVPAADAANPFHFADGDRVVMIGGTLIEREQKSGDWELALMLLNKDKTVTFRNLGWSGDTVWGESRGSFDGQPKGYQKLVSLTKELKPTVIVFCYGQVESFAGEKGVAPFVTQFDKLLDAVADTKARVVLLAPPPFEDVKPLTDAAAKNANLKLYVAATKHLAEKRKLQFVDWFNYSDPKETKPLTENGIHMAAAGYAETAKRIHPTPLSHADTETVALVQKLQATIVAKNELFFYRWRPQNETYLFGFRKHEQGNNGKEIPEFDPLVEAKEKEIAELRSKLK
jgi:lysophospholipase L1-like esterase